jgi:hypothetical protein
MVPNGRVVPRPEMAAVLVVLPVDDHKWDTDEANNNTSKTLTFVETNGQYTFAAW